MLSNYFFLSKAKQILSPYSSAPSLCQGATMAIIHYIWKPNLLSGVKRTSLLPVLIATTRKIIKLESEQGYSSATS